MADNGAAPKGNLAVAGPPVAQKFEDNMADSQPLLWRHAKSAGLARTMEFWG